MIVETVLHIAKSRLSTTSPAASLTEVAGVFGTGATRMLIVCDRDGRASGVVTRTDAMKRVGAAEDPLSSTVADFMSRDVISALASDDLMVTWQMMLRRGLNHVPVLDPDRKPMGVLSSDDVLKILLQSEQYEERLLSDYVAGIGYR